MGFSSGSGNSQISTSTDVILNNPKTGDVLTYNATNAKWQNLPVSSIVTPGTKGLCIGFTHELALTQMNTADSLAAVTAFAAAGSKWMRYDYQYTGSSDGTVRNGISDTIISQTIAKGMSVLILLGDATGGVSATDGYCGAWMTSAISHLSSLGVHYFEVQNEMNLGANWNSGTSSVTAYVNTLKAAYPIIHAADPQATVLHTGLAPYGQPTGSIQSGNYNPFDFLSAMYAAGAQGYFDAGNFHCYSFPDLPSTYNTYNTFANLEKNGHATMVANGDGWKKIWITEFGVATGTDAGYASGNVATQTVQAQVVTLGYQMAKGWPFIGPTLLYNWIDSSTDGDYGLYTSTGTKKLSYDAYVAQ